MKRISEQLQLALAKSVTALVYCVKITRTDGDVIGFTMHDADIVVDNVLYYAANSAAPSTISSASRMSVDNLDLQGLLAKGVLSSDKITDVDLRNGKYDDARVDVYIVDWTNPGAGSIHMKRGWIGTVKIESGQYNATVVGLTQALHQSFGLIATAPCRALFGDKLCRFDAESLRQNGYVYSVQDGLNFTVADLTTVNGRLFSFGEITWLTGRNAGNKIEVKKDGGQEETRTITLPTPTASPISVGDTFSIIPGCKKTVDDCNSYNNLKNYRGFPTVPGYAKLTQVAS